MQRTRAFSLLEVMAVVAVIGVLATLAVPSFQDLAAHYRAAQGFRSGLSVITQGRSLAQRQNVPVRVRVFADRAEFDTANVTGGADSVRKLVNGFTVAAVARVEEVRFTELRLFDAANTLVSTQPAGSAAATFIFCPSSDNYFRDSVTLEPLCGVGNLASSNAHVVMSGQGETQHVLIRRALGSADLRVGS